MSRVLGQKAISPSDVHEVLKGAESLQALLALLQALGDSGTRDDDLSDLPLFGGQDPRETGEDGNAAAVWSWDATHMLVGLCVSEMKIVPRVTT